MRTKSSIKIKMTITIKFVPLISDLRLSTRLLYAGDILAFSRAARQGARGTKLFETDFVSYQPGQE